jgi:hypothetical protein
MVQEQATSLGIEYLYGYWQRALRVAGAPEGSVDLDHTLLSGLRVNILETMRFLHDGAPSFEAFEAWIVERNGGALEEPALDRLRRALRGETVGSEIGSLDGVEGLSESDLRHWDEHGYVVLKHAVTPEQAKAAEMAIYAYLGMDPERPESWYGGKQGHSIWVSLLRHPAFWATRRSPRMVKAFAQLWGREDLWVTVDQGGLNPPEREGWRFPGPHLHWDTTIAPPHHFGIQGILYLADVAENQGAFTCIPGFHRKLESWLASLPEGVDPREAIFQHGGAKPIAAGAGDMVLWHQSLPHGSSPNRAARPRVAQYITMKPTRWEYHDVWR